MAKLWRIPTPTEKIEKLKSLTPLREVSSKTINLHFIIFCFIKIWCDEFHQGIVSFLCRFPDISIGNVLVCQGGKDSSDDTGCIRKYHLSRYRYKFVHPRQGSCFYQHVWWLTVHHYNVDQVTEINLFWIHLDLLQTFAQCSLTSE